MDRCHTPLKLRRTSEYNPTMYPPPPRSPRRFPLRRTSAPIQLSHSNTVSRTSLVSSSLEKNAETPLVPTKHPRRTPSIPKVDPMFQDPLPKWTRKECNEVVDEVKRLFFKGRYKHCSEKCIKILENPRGLIHDIYSLYLSFYAATCLELQSMPLCITSTSKLSLLKHAKAYYEIAASYIHLAEKNVFPSMLSESHSRSCSPSIVCSSPRSSTSSVFSKISPFSSPTSSVYDSDDLEREKEYQSFLAESGSRRARPLAIYTKKRVSFVDDSPTVSSRKRSSATMKENNPIFSTPPTIKTSTENLRAVPPRSFPLVPGPPPKVPLPPLPPMKKKPSLKTVTVSATRLSIESAQPEITNSQAMIQYQSQLLTLKPRISYHLTTISILIHEITIASEVDASSETLDISSFLKSRQEQLNRGQEENETISHQETRANLDTEDRERTAFSERKYMSLKDKRARIEAGRARGWMRVRFDGERYQKLCERALVGL